MKIMAALLAGAVALTTGNLWAASGTEDSIERLQLSSDTLRAMINAPDKGVPEEVVNEVPGGVHQPGKPDDAIRAKTVVRDDDSDRREGELPETEAAADVRPHRARVLGTTPKAYRRSFAGMKGAAEF